MGLFTIALQWYSQSGYQGVKFQLLLIITHSTVAIVGCARISSISIVIIGADKAALRGTIFKEVHTFL